MARLIAFPPPRIAMSLVLVAVAAHLLAGLRLHDVHLLPAMVLACAGFAIMLRAWWLFRLADTAICPTAKSSMLLTHDVYAFTRNPMYLGITMMLVALALAVGALPYYVCAVAFFLAMDRTFCPHEEAKARDEFGSDYVAYLRRVRRWL